MAKDDEVQDKLDSLLHLMSGRQGTSDDDAIERAISSLLSNVPNVAAGNPSTTKARDISHASTKIIVDEDDYDDDCDGDGKKDSLPTNTNAKIPTPHASIAAEATGEKRLKWSGENVSVESLQKQEDELKILQDKDRSQTQTAIKIPEWKNLEEVPLGRTGARIMITFGDGPTPNPDACTVALLATRQCLQTAIKDARALRRKMKREYEKARVAVKIHKAGKKERSILGQDAEGAKEVNMDLYFKAIAGVDRKLSYENPAGFDETQLEKLFPEEMHAYQRWNKMHQEYTETKDSGSTNIANKDPLKDEEQETEEIKNDVTMMEGNDGGHLRDRLAQFDVRTERMKEQWYLAFSEVRKGSFLDRGGLTSEARAWEKDRKKVGRKKTCTWEALPSSHIQFLHWIGFDQRSPLPPPDASTTEALAFLAHDFMGKIVEKSIFLKHLKRREEMTNVQVDAELVLEVGSNDQLTKDDIELALSDSTVVPKPLYNALESTLDSIDAAQIYFGPGFEERIEMEMEQIFMKKKKNKELPVEELEIRAKEDALFEKLKAPPSLLAGVTDVLNDKSKSKAVAIQRSNDKKRRIEREELKRNELVNAFDGVIVEPEQKKRQRGSRKTKY